MKRTSLTVLLPAVFFGTLILFLGGYSAFVLSNMRTALMDQAVRNVELASERGAKRVEDWFVDTERNLLSTAEAKQTRDSIAMLSAILRGTGPDAARFLNETYVVPNTAVGPLRDEYDYSSDRSAYGQSHTRIHDVFRTIRRENGYYDIFLFDASGVLLYTVAKEPDLGLNALSGPLSETTLGTAFRRALDAPTPTVVFEDFVPYTFSAGAPAGFMAVQVLNDRDEKVGVLAIQLPIDVLTQIVRDSDLDGRSYSFTLLGPDGSLRMDHNSAALGQLQVPTPQFEAAIGGEIGVIEDTLSVDGTAVLAAFRPVTSLGSRWSLVTERDQSVVMAPLWREMRLALIAVVVLGIVALGVGLLIGRWLARPLAQLTEATGRLMAREEVTISHLTRRDEVGELARGLERFRLDQLAAEANRREMIFKGKAFDTTRTAMMIADAEGTLLYVNDALIKLFRGNLKSMQARYPTMDVDRLVGMNISIFHSNHGRVMNLLRDPKNGQIAPDVQVGADTYALSVSAVDDADGTRAGYVVVWEDVRELRRVKAVMNAVDAGQVILEVDTEGRVLRINAQGTVVYGYTQDQICGQPLAILFKNGAAEANSVLKRVLADGSLSEFHHRVARDGTDRFVICNLNVVRDGRGNAERIVAICTDQTEETLYRRAAESQTEVRNRDLAVVVNGLRDTLGGMAEGDLSRTIESAFPPEYESLRQNCNQAIHGLSAALQQVSAVADGILSGADEISNAASDLSRRTESQAATLEQTAAALDSLTSSVRNATEGTLKAGQRVTSAHDEAHANGSVVRKAIDAMTAIETSSNQISKIITVIDDIAFQTNLLALNAGVEAARAGDAGRGFAVVAAEVRALAQRSSEAAREIKTLISTSEAQVVTGAELVNQSGRAVEAIVGDVAEISRLVNTISQSSQDQANGLAEINAGVMVLDKVTQQNAVMVEQSTAASAALKHEVDALSGLLAGFKLVGAPASAPGYRKSRHAA